MLVCALRCATQGFAKIPISIVVGGRKGDAGFRGDNGSDSRLEGGGVNCHLAAEGMSKDADALRVSVGDRLDEINKAAGVRNPLAKTRCAGMAEGEVGNSFCVEFAIALTEPADGDYEIAVLRADVGEGADAWRSESAAAEVEASRSIDIVIGNDEHRQTVGRR